ncbi:MAG: hypothetical protein SGPRY_002424 [Prymnesium sp.]
MENDASYLSLLRKKKALEGSWPISCSDRSTLRLSSELEAHDMAVPHISSLSSPAEATVPLVSSSPLPCTVSFPVGSTIPFGVSAAMPSPLPPLRHMPPTLDAHAAYRNIWANLDDLPSPKQASPLFSFVAGPCKFSTLAATPARLLLVACGESGKMLSIGGVPWCVSLIGPGSARVGLTDLEDGTTCMEFTCSTSGTYRLHVRLGQATVYSGRLLVFDSHAAPHLALARHVFMKEGGRRHTTRSLFRRWGVWLAWSSLSQAVRGELMEAAHRFCRRWSAREAIGEMARHGWLRKVVRCAKTSECEQESNPAHKHAISLRTQGLFTIPFSSFSPPLPPPLSLLLLAYQEERASLPLGRGRAPWLGGGGYAELAESIKGEGDGAQVACKPDPLERAHPTLSLASSRREREQGRFAHHSTQLACKRALRTWLRVLACLPHERRAI